MRVKIPENKKSFSRLLRKHATYAEKTLWNLLKNRQLRGSKFRRQQPFRGYILDFVSYENKIVVELDGSQHTNEHQKQYDLIRTELLKSEGFIVLRFWNSDVINNTEAVLEVIATYLNPHSNPLPRGRGYNVK